ncbi:nucleotidyltransferase domain-containing protein [Rhodovibrio sodomensis]|nr:nucleotidyltransferase domain-containing protein [Rhodovibrio sodomensis]
MASDLPPVLIAADLDPEEAKVLHACQVAIERHLPSAEISLFGSRARRDHRSDSDYDLLVLFDREGPRMPEEGEARLERDALALAGRAAKLNLQLIPQDRVEELVFEYPFMGPALSEGVALPGLLEHYFRIDAMRAQRAASEASGTAKPPSSQAKHRDAAELT